MGPFLAVVFALIPTQTGATEYAAFFEQVSLSISPVRSTYYVAEPIHLKLTMRNTGSTRVRGFLQVRPHVNTFDILYRKAGSEFRHLSLRDSGGIDEDVPARVLEPGQESTNTVVLAFDETANGPLLDEPGVYEFQLIYRGSIIRGIPIESNVVTIQALTPPSEYSDSAATFVAAGLSRLAQHDGRLPAVTDELVPAAERFLSEYPNSPYTRDVWWGLFLYLEHRANSPGATESIKRLYERLSVAEEVHQPRFGENDMIAPTIALSPSAVQLWPPNHRMVTVSVAVSVSDNEDPNPVVKLVSVTCDDGCVPADDVVGAELGTDDREFELRAERKGSGTGRTYLITYSATDASENRAQATTAVAVPHDQGKK